jgi:hypothetical protein
VRRVLLTRKQANALQDIADEACGVRAGLNTISELFALGCIEGGTVRRWAITSTGRAALAASTPRAGDKGDSDG